MERGMLRAGRRIAAALSTLALLASGCATPGGSGLSMPGVDASTVIEKWRARKARDAAHAEDERAPGPASVADLLEQGDRLRDTGDLAAALFAYVRAHRQAGGDLSPGERIGYVHLREDPTRSEAIFRMLIAEHPEAGSLRTGLALSLLAQKRAAEAREALVTAIQLDPRAATPRNLIAVIHDRLRDHAAAQEQYRVAHELRPADAAVLNNWGVSLLVVEDYAQAVSVLRKASHLEPGDAAIANNLALAVGMTGPEGEAEAFALFTRAGGEARAHNNLGFVLHLRGEHERAIARFEQALGVAGAELPTVIANLEAARAALEAPVKPPAPPVATPVAEVAQPEPSAQAVAAPSATAEPPQPRAVLARPVQTAAGPPVAAVSFRPAPVAVPALEAAPALEPLAAPVLEAPTPGIALSEARPTAFDLEPDLEPTAPVRAVAEAEAPATGTLDPWAEALAPPPTDAAERSFEELLAELLSDTDAAEAGEGEPDAIERDADLEAPAAE